MKGRQTLSSRDGLSIINTPQARANNNWKTLRRNFQKFLLKVLSQQSEDTGRGKDYTKKLVICVFVEEHTLEKNNLLLVYKSMP